MDGGRFTGVQGMLGVNRPQAAGKPGESASPDPGEIEPTRPFGARSIPAAALAQRLAPVPIG
jgi:hypothetical protein